MKPQAARRGSPEPCVLSRPVRPGKSCGEAVQADYCNAGKAKESSIALDLNSESGNAEAE